MAFVFLETEISMKKALLIPVIFLCFFKPAYSQSQRTVDSLIHVVETAKDDTFKVRLLNSLALNFLKSGDYENALSYANNTLLLAQKIKSTQGVLYANSTLGIIYFQQGDYPEALKKYAEVVEASKELNDKKGLAKTYNNIGTVYDVLGNYPAALKNYFAALKIAEEIKDKKVSAATEMNIGIVYEEQGNYPAAIKNYYEALRMAKENNDKQTVAYVYNNIGNVSRKEGKYQEALINHFESLNIKEEIGDTLGIIHAYVNLGEVYDDLKQLPEAKKYFIKSLTLSKRINNKLGIADSYLNLGKISLKKKEYSKASEYLNNGLLVAKEIGIKDQMKDCYSYLSQLYSAQGDIAAAYQYHLLYDRMKDSILNENSSNQIYQLKIQYESEKKEKELEGLKIRNELQLQKTRTYFLLLVALFLLMVIGFWFQLRVRKRKLIISQKEIEKKNLELKNKDLSIEKERAEERAQVQEEIGKQYHDNIGSKITSLIFMCENERAKENDRSAELRWFASKVSSKLKDIAEMNRSGIIALDPDTNELDAFIAKLWLDLNDLVETAGKEIEFTIPQDIPKIMVSPKVKFNISSIMKEAINNFIKYSASGEVIINIEIKNSRYLINIVDHGVGMDVDKRNPRSYGFKNMKSRIESIGGTIEIASKPGEGTIIRLQGDFLFTGEMKIKELY